MSSLTLIFKLFVKWTFTPNMFAKCPNQANFHHISFLYSDEGTPKAFHHRLCRKSKGFPTKESFRERMHIRVLSRWIDKENWDYVKGLLWNQVLKKCQTLTSYAMYEFWISLNSFEYVTSRSRMIFSCEGPWHTQNFIKEIHIWNHQRWLGK